MIPSLSESNNTKAKKLTAKEAAAIVEEARERIQDSWDHDKDNRRDAASDMRFLTGDQWPYDVRRAEMLPAAPCLPSIVCRSSSGR